MEMRAGARRDADLDLLARLRNGSFIYPALLLFVDLATPYRADHPKLFWSAVAAIAVALGIRLAMSRWSERLYQRGRRSFLVPLILSLALSGGATGFLLLTIAQQYGFTSRPFTLIMMWVAGIASGSTIAFTPVFSLLLLQLVVVLAPVTAYECAHGSAFTLSLGLATLVFFAFHVVQGYRLSGMYADLTASRLLEKLRMRELEQAKSRADVARERLQYQATHDPLTRVVNHAQILILLDDALDRAHHTQTPFGLVILDLDRFKCVNDQFGHLAGDEVLRAIADAIKASVRGASDLVGRYGGEEFLIILPGCGFEDSTAGADRIREAIQDALVTWEHAQLKITASLGVTVCDPRSDTSPRELITRADRALYRAKRKGRNRVEFERPESSSMAPTTPTELIPY